MIGKTIGKNIYNQLNSNNYIKRYITNGVYEMAKKVMPKISPTEQAALDAGTIGFDRDLFSGNPSLKELLKKYKPSLTDEEQSFLDNETNELLELIDDHKVCQDKDLPPEAWDYMKKKGFFGMIIPKEYGGKGFSGNGHSQVVQKINSGCGAAGATVAVPNSLGPAELLMRYGTQEQKDYFLPKLADGTLIPCFGLTSPHSGSDAASMKEASGKVVKENGVLGIRASFKKRYITLGPVAGVIGLAFHLEDPDNLLNGKGTAGPTIALLERDHPGLEIGKRHDPLGISFMNGPFFGENVFIPMDHLIGGQERAGFGWNMLMDCLAEGRSISLPAAAVAACKMTTIAVGGYARIRKQFKVPVADLGGVQEPISRIASNTLLVTAAQQLINSMVDGHEQPAVLSAIMKQQTTHRSQRTVIDGMDILGGAGICQGPNNFLGTGYQGAPIAITVEGANILTRSMMIFGQGLTRAHPHMQDLVQTIQKGNDSSGFRKEVFNMIGHASSNLFRSLFRSINPLLPKSNLTSYYESQFLRLSSNFALCSDLALSLGGKLKFEELTSGRMADVLSNLYLGYATLWYYEQNKHVTGLDKLMDFTLSQLLVDTQNALFEAAENFPIRPVGLAMKYLSYPLFGQIRYNAPKDKLRKEVTELISKPSAVRDLFEENIFISKDKNNRVRMIYDWFPKAVEADELRAKLKKEKREPTSKEQEFLNSVDEAIDQIVQVDAFDKLGIELQKADDYMRPALKTFYEMREVQKKEKKLQNA